MQASIATIEEFEIEFQRLLKILTRNIDDDYYPRNFHGDILRFDVSPGVTFDSPRGDATPFIEISHGQFNYVISERGKELKRVAGTAADVLALLFQHMTFSLAGAFESRNRIEGQDSRRAMFAKQIELLRILNPAWAASEENEHLETLKSHPFDDSVSARIEYSQKHGWEEASKKYPLPKL